MKCPSMIVKEAVSYKHLNKLFIKGLKRKATLKNMMKDPFALNKGLAKEWMPALKKKLNRLGGRMVKKEWKGMSLGNRKVLVSSIRNAGGTPRKVLTDPLFQI